MTSAQFVQTRKFYFAQLVADADIEACKAAKTFTLPLATARVFFAKATKLAERDRAAITRRQARRATRR